MFDLRHLEHSTIIYEARRPLLRLAWNGMDPNYIATLAMDVTEVIILDVRVPCTPVAKLSNHGAAGKFKDLGLIKTIHYSEWCCMGTTLIMPRVHCW